MPDPDPVVAVVKQLHSLCLDPGNRPYICRRGVLPTLSAFLKHSDIAVSLLACQSVMLLSLHPDNLELLRREPGLEESLWGLFREFHTLESTSQHLTLCDTVAQTILLLSTSSFFQPASSTECQPQPAAFAPPPLMDRKDQIDRYLNRRNKYSETLKMMADRDALSKKTHRSDPNTRLAAARSASIEAKENQEADAATRRTIIFRIGSDARGPSAVQQVHRRHLESLLLGIAGVISFSFVAEETEPDASAGSRNSLGPSSAPLQLQIYTRLEGEKLERMLRVRAPEVPLALVSAGTDEAFGLRYDELPTHRASRGNSAPVPEYLSEEEIKKMDARQKLANARAVLTSRGDDSLAARARRLREQNFQQQQQQQQPSSDPSAFAGEGRWWKFW